MGVNFNSISLHNNLLNNLVSHEIKTHLIKEHLSFPQDVLEFRKLEEVPLEGFGVLIHLTELILELFEGGL